MDDYFARTRTHNDDDDDRNLRRQRSADQRVPASPFPQFESNNELTLAPTIRLRRMPSRLPSTYRERQQPAPEHVGTTSTTDHAYDRRSQEEQESRRRSFSAPQRPSASMLAEAQAARAARRNEPQPQMATLDEESASRAAHANKHTNLSAPRSQRRLRASSSAAWRRLRGNSTAESTNGPPAADSIELAERRQAQAASDARAEQHNRQMVDLLDVVDPEVSTLTTLNNVQNSLFIPNLGRWFNRTATYDLSMHEDSATPTDTDLEPDTDTDAAAVGPKRTHETIDEGDDEDQEELETPQESSVADRTPGGDSAPQTRLKRSHTLTSVLSEKERRHKDGEEHNFAILPHGVTLEGWSDEDKDALNDHVRHLLHSRREGFKRSMRGFGKYVRTWTGFFITLYAFLLTFWGAAWVLFLIGWLSVQGRQAYFVEICDQILTALFAVVGLGMAPFRAVDTYHMIYVAKYHYRTWEEREKRALPALADPNDLPEPVAARPASPDGAADREFVRKAADATTGERQHAAKLSSSSDSSLSQNPAKAAAVAQGDMPPRQEIVDLEAALPAVEKAAAKSGRDDGIDDDPDAVLTPRQWSIFKHHQQKFQKSHTFYRPHETYTHHAFPIKLLITAVVLLDFHSIFQACLGGTTWGIYYKRRPKALTAVILTCSICCNISAGLVISIGDRQTRKKAVVEQLFRQEITKQAMRRLNRDRGLRLPKEAMKPSREEQAATRAAEKAADKAARKSMDVSRKSLEQSLRKRSMEASRAGNPSIEVSRPSADMLRPSVDTRRPGV